MQGEQIRALWTRAGMTAGRHALLLGAMEPHPGPGRPQGDVSVALMCAASQAPATVRELAVRAGVGYAVARYTASRLASRGALVALSEGRPRVLMAAPAMPAPHHRARSFWEEAAAVAVVRPQHDVDDEAGGADA